MKKRLVVITAGVLALSVGVYVSTKLWAQPPVAAQAPRAQTRIGLVNVGFVLRNYKKMEAFTSEDKATYIAFDEAVKKKSQDMEGRKKQLADPTLVAQQEAIRKEITKLQREMEDLNVEMKKRMTEQQDHQMVIIYREVYDAASRYAVSKGMDMVLTYNEAVKEDDFFNPMNIMDKIRQRSCTPLYFDKSMDISRDIVDMLNRSYQAPAPASAQTAPATTPH